MTIAYYITSHGFGHFVRSAAVIKRLPREAPLLIRTDTPEWFRRQELAGCSFTLLPAGLDCGTTGPDSTTVDIEASVTRAERVHADAEKRLADELRIIREHDVRLIVTDMMPFALRVASEAGVPSVCITNFTWVEIFGALAVQARDRGMTALADRGDALVASMREQYALGDLLLVPGMALDMGACRRRLATPIIARTGRPRRRDLCEKLGLNPDDRIYLLYLGQEGYKGMEWERLGEIGGAQFFTFTPFAEDVENIHLLPPGLIDHSDATATADAVIGKLGYSLCAECAATRRALVFPPRPDFVEAEALGAAMMKFGLGVPITPEDFTSLNWIEKLKAAPSLSARAEPVDCTGAAVCADLLTRAWRSGSTDGLSPEPTA